MLTGSWVTPPASFHFSCQKCITYLYFRFVKQRESLFGWFRATNASVLTILAFSVERYLAICHPLRSKAMSNLRRAVRIIAAIWLASLVCAIPYTLGSELVALNISQPYFACRYESDDAFLVSHYFVGIASSICFFAIPFTVLVVLYSRITIVLRNRGNIGECRTLNPNTKSVIWMLAAVVFSFFLCWAPFHLHRIIYFNFQIDGDLKTIEKDLYSTSGFTFYLSSTINPILYNLMSAKYRNAFKATLCNQKN
ncbi:neuropeptides capa receptor-like [Cloeon dipterum]|uniref:neuropeptides capa receptor-like n=1 Tax=Cloeon dipterum TaxID=197152 RepID=UPI00321FB26F